MRIFIKKGKKVYNKAFRDLYINGSLIKKGAGFLYWIEVGDESINISSSSMNKSDITLFYS